MENPEELKYVCPRCHYSTDHRSHFVGHLKKKYICPNMYSSVDPKRVIRDHETIEKPFPCTVEGCTKQFTYSSGLSRHIKLHHNDREDQDNDQNPDDEDGNANTNANAQGIQGIQDALVPPTITTTLTDRHDSSSIDHSHNNNNLAHSQNTNTTTLSNNHIENHTHIANLTVNILPFGQERINHVEQNTELLEECINQITTKGIPDIVDAVYFNAEVPENHNVTIGRKNPPEMKVFATDASGVPSWKSMEKSGVLHHLVDKGARILIKYNEHVFSVQQERGMTDEDREKFDWRSARLTNITLKARGSSYAPIKNAVLLRAEEHAKKLMEQETATATATATAMATATVARDHVVIPGTEA